MLAGGDASYGAAIVGVDPSAEAEVSTLHATVRQGRYLNAGDDGVAVLGDVFARNLGLKVGDSITLLGSALDGTIAADRLTLVGVFHTGIPELDRQLAEMPLGRFQRDFGLGDKATLVVLSGPSLAAVNRRPSADPRTRRARPSDRRGLGLAAAGAKGGDHPRLLDRHALVRNSGGGRRFHHPQHASDVCARANPRVRDAAGDRDAAGSPRTNALV